MPKKIILFLLLFLAMTVGGAAEQTKGLTFVGKIQEIASKTGLTLRSAGNYLAIRLDSNPKLDFRLSAKDAARYGLIEEKGQSAILTPGRLKGLGWTVRLTCDKKTTLSDPIYEVTKLEILKKEN